MENSKLSQVKLYDNNFTDELGYLDEKFINDEIIKEYKEKGYNPKKITELLEKNPKEIQIKKEKLQEKISKEKKKYHSSEVMESLQEYENLCNIDFRLIEINDKNEVIEKKKKERKIITDKIEKITTEINNISESYFTELGKIKKIDGKNIKEYEIWKKESNIYLNEYKEKLKDINYSLKILYNQKKGIKKLKEKRKEIIKNNLNNRFINIHNLENYIEYIDKNNNLINDKKFIEIGKKIDSMDKSIIESVINYFIINCIDKNYFINKKYINKLINRLYSNSELKQLDELQPFQLKSIKSNYIENYNYNYIIKYIKEYEGICKTRSNNLNDIIKLLQEMEINKECYKFTLQLIKLNEKNIKNLKEYKERKYKEYQKKENQINMNVKRKSEKIIERYGLLLENGKNIDGKFIINSDEKWNKSDLKKLNYKNKILQLKNGLYKKYNYNEILTDKFIKFENFIDKNPDIDMDKLKTFKKLKTIIQHTLKTK